MNSTFDPNPTPGFPGAIELTVGFILSFMGLIILLWLVLPMMEEEIRSTDFKDWWIRAKKNYRHDRIHWRKEDAN